jgi:predicted transcriptional regulator
MALEPELLQQCLDLRADSAAADADALRARDAYHAALVRLHRAGGRLREIAEALDLSHQRVHQIVKGDSATSWSCTFCGGDRETGRIIGGPGVFICYACVDQVAERYALAPKKAKCSFCNKRTGEVEEMRAGPGVLICSECVELCRQIMAESPA